MLLLMLSGMEDLAFFLVNSHPPGEFNPIPQVWDWVPHMSVRLGHHPSLNEVYAFITVHFVLAAWVLFYPFNWLKKWYRQLELEA